jgi:hypothetical protein
MSPDKERRPRREGGDHEVAGGNVNNIVPPEADADLDDIAAQLRRRRAASWRLPPMPCGHHDPLDCRAAS